MSSNKSPSRDCGEGPIKLADDKDILSNLADTDAIHPLREWVGFSLRLAHLVSQQDFARTVTKSNHRPVHFSILAATNSQLEVTQTQMSKIIGVKRENIAVLVRELETKGLIK